MGTRKAGFWKADWFLGLTVSIVMLAASNSDLIGSLERNAYDLCVQASNKKPSGNIAIIAIDDYSIANIGRWAWPRDRLAKMTDMLPAGQSKLIANIIFFFEPQIDPGYTYVKQLQEFFQQALVAATVPEVEQMGTLLPQAEATLNTDRILSQSISKSGRTLLPMLFVVGEPQVRPDKAIPAFIARNSLSQISNKQGDIWPTISAQTPIEALGSQAGSSTALPKVISIVARVASALAYAHGNNVVHHDVKPANVMYEPESGQVKVTYLSIARINDSSRTKTGMVLGTPGHMSPEQLSGKKIDGRSDLFSLGVMLYLLCCWKLPFVGESMTQLMFKIANERYQRGTRWRTIYAPAWPP